MSHITDVKLKIRDLDALEEAAARLGLELRRGQRSYSWYGHFMRDSNDYGEIAPEEMGKGEHALRAVDHQAGDYEIGLHKAKDGDGYTVAFDTWGPGAKLLAKVGPRANALRREYSAAVASKRAMATVGKKGYVLSREANPTPASPNGFRLKLRKR